MLHTFERKYMKKKSNNKVNLIIVITAIAIMIIIAIIIIAVFNKRKKSDTYPQQSAQSSEDIEDEINVEEEIERLPESRRMKRYVGLFFENIENKDYQSAYNVLNEDFKSTYFPTLDKFKEYAEKYFDTSTMGIIYNDVERLGNKKTGNLYFLWLSIGNIYRVRDEDEEDEDREETNFVILERDYNNYEMSFSVNEE